MSGDPFGVVLFCDDIRREASGKLIMVGVYTGKMVVADLPAALPQLNVVVLTGQPKDDVADRVDVVVHFPDGVEARQSLEWPSPSPERKAVLAEEDVTHSAETAIVRLSDVQIADEGRIVVYLDVRGRRVRVGSLEVVKETAA